MASFTCRILTLFVICTALQEGSGLPLSEQPAQAPHPPRIRTKRCSCNNWDDKECIYFCHLDVIWVNTPSKLLPYGLGSSPSRRRRSANRCECLNAADETCRGFCLKSLCQICVMSLKSMSMQRVSQGEMMVVAQYEGSRQSWKQGPHTCQGLERNHKARRTSGLMLQSPWFNLEVRKATRCWLLSEQRSRRTRRWHKTFCRQREAPLESDD